MNEAETAAMKTSPGSVNEAKYVAAAAVSFVGDGLLPIAVTVSILDAGMGLGVLALMLASRAVGVAVGTLPAAKVLAVLSMKRALILADLVRGGVLVGVVCAFHQDVVSTAVVLCVLMFAFGVAEATYRVLSKSAAVRVTSQLRLQRLNARLGIAAQVGLVVGPALSAPLAGWISPEGVILVDVLTFVVSAVFLACCSFSSSPGVVGREQPRLVDAARKMWSIGWLRVFVVLGVLESTFAMTYWMVVTPIAMELRDGSLWFYGVAMGLYAVGGVVGGVFAGRYSFRQPGVQASVAIALFSLPIAAILCGLSGWALWVPHVLAGLGMQVFTVVYLTSLQVSVSKQMLPGVVATSSLMTAVSVPLGYLLLSQAQSPLVQGVFGWFGVATCFSFVVVAVCSGAMRGMSMRNPKVDVA